MALRDQRLIQESSAKMAGSFVEIFINKKTEMVLRAKSNAVPVCIAVEVVQLDWLKKGQIAVDFFSEKEGLSCPSIVLTDLQMRGVKSSNFASGFSLNKNKKFIEILSIFQ